MEAPHHFFASIRTWRFVAVLLALHATCGASIRLREGVVLPDEWFDALSRAQSAAPGAAAAKASSSLQQLGSKAVPTSKASPTANKPPPPSPPPSPPPKPPKRTPTPKRPPPTPPSPRPPLFKPPPPSPPPPSPQGTTLRWTVLPTYQQMSSYLAALPSRSGGRCALSSLGKSGAGRELWLVTVGNASSPHYPDPLNPTVPFPKPKFAVIGNMHGDETGNLMVLLQFVDELCAGTPLDARVQALVDSTVLYIVPSMNPDGFVAEQRFNSRGVDLNRNVFTKDFPFPRPTFNQLGPDDGEAYFFLMRGGTAMEAETKAVTSWLSSVRPQVSANLHGGALVACYSLDACDSLGRTTDCDSPEAPLPRFLANAYAMQHETMRATLTDPDGFGNFVNGTTQGANWYTALGTLADWMHWALRLHMVTLELHDIKSPPAGSALSSLYADNRASLLRLAEMAHLGLRAVLRDGASGRPLAARVTLKQPAGLWPPQVEPGGYLWRLAVPGTNYSGTLQPYDPADSAAAYDPIPFRFALAAGWDDLIQGTGTGGLSQVATFLARRRNP